MSIVCFVQDLAVIEKQKKTKNAAGTLTACSLFQEALQRARKHLNIEVRAAQHSDADGLEAASEAATSSREGSGGTGEAEWALNEDISDTTGPTARFIASPMQHAIAPYFQVGPSCSCNEARRKKQLQSKPHGVVYSCVLQQLHGMCQKIWCSSCEWLSLVSIALRCWHAMWEQIIPRGNMRLNIVAMLQVSFLIWHRLGQEHLRGTTRQRCRKS